MECKSCGHLNAENTNFCVNCGANLSYSNNQGDIATVNENSGLAIVSMILGIISAVFGVICCFGYVSATLAIVCGIMAILFAILSWKSSKRNYAIAGLICGICGLVLGIIILVILLNEAYFIEFIEQYEQIPFETIIKALL